MAAGLLEAQSALMTCEKHDEEEVDVKGEIKTLSVFNICDKGIQTIEPVSASSAWIGQENEDELKLISKEGSICDTVSHSYSNIFIYDAESFVLANRETEVIRHLIHTGKSEIIFSSELSVVGVGRALNGNLLITLMDELSGSRTPESRRLVQMVTPGGELLHTYQYDKDGVTPALTFIARTLQNYNSDVCVVTLECKEEDGKEAGQICVFFEEGDLKFIYEGCGKPFLTFDICADSLCNIICANAIDDNVHIIDSNGQFLKYLFTKETCIPDIRCIALKDNILWVGSENGEVRTYRYTE